ncbi:NAD-dependent epimerase/dehydratase family protein [Pantoea sp. PNT02]|uniref:NAD-dependent epimerase/dehydratase family protein n=1 Tax=Pantoea sp. PNT02 TaxID=2769261 RepID=UPI001CE1CD35
MHQKPVVLILGATGTIGSHIVKELDDKEVHLRIASRKQDTVDQLRRDGKARAGGRRSRFPLNRLQRCHAHAE